MARVALVIPCYNEATRLALATFRAFDLPGHEFSFLFVDDGSTDGTAEILDDLCHEDPSRRSWMRLAENQGKAEAVRHGVLRALEQGVDQVGYWDADLATPLDELERFCRVLDRFPPIGMVFGSRVQLLGRTIRRHTHRHAFGRVFATVVSQMLSLAVYDTQCGSKLFRASDDLARVFAEPFVSRWVFDVEVIARFIELYEPRSIDIADRIYELPLRRWTDVAGSKIGPADALLAARDLTRIANKHRAVLRQRRKR